MTALYIIFSVAFIAELFALILDWPNLGWFAIGVIAGLSFFGAVTLHSLFWIVTAVLSIIYSVVIFFLS